MGETGDVSLAWLLQKLLLEAVSSAALVDAEFNVRRDAKIKDDG